MKKTQICKVCFVAVLLLGIASGCAPKDPTLDAAPTPAPGASVVPVEGSKKKMMDGAPGLTGGSDSAPAGAPK